MPQRIGLSAVLTTTDFNTGLQAYITGLNRAINATTMAANAIRQQASGINNILGGAAFQQGVTNYTNGLNTVVTATRTAAQNMAAAINSIPRLPTPTGRQAPTPAVGGGGAAAAAGGGVSSSLQTDLRIAKLLEDEVRDIAALEKTRETIADTTASKLQKTLALRHQEVIEAKQLVREQELLNLGVQPNVIQRLRSTQRGPSPNQREQEILQLQQEELRDLIVLEQARRTLADKTATEFQKQLAILNQQAVAARQQERGSRLSDLGVNQGAIDRLRNTPIVMRDLAGATRQVTKEFGQLNVRAIALGTAIGHVVHTAIRALTNGLIQMTNGVINTVTFFERLGLSIEFYSVRALKAEGITTDFNTGLKLVRKEAEGTLIWLQKLALESPFTSKDVGTLFRTAQAYGLVRKEAVLLTPLLLDFAAAAGLDEDILERLALALGQVRARGKLTGEEVRQLGNSGIPIRDILVDSLGIANSEFDEMVEKGKLLSGIVIPAIIKWLEDFRGAGKRIQFETIGGIKSAFEELAQFGTFRLFKGILDPLREQLVSLFNTLSGSKILARLQVIGQAIGTFLASAFRSLAITINGLIKSWQALDPVMKRQIITFGLGVVVVTLFAAAVGLLTLAFKLLFNRITLITLAIGAFVSAWTNGFQSVIDTAVQMGNVVGTVFKGISGLFSTFFSHLGFGDAPSALGRTIGDDLNAGFRDTRGEIKKEAKKELDAVAGDALIAGNAAGGEFLKGWHIPNPAKTISKELQEALDRFGSGPQLSQAGARAVAQFFEPFKSLDFSFFDQVSGTLRNVLQNAVNLGEIKDTDLPSRLFGGQKAIAAAIAEFRRIGSITQKTMDGVRKATGGAGKAIVGFLGTFTQLASATDVVEVAQQKLNDITDKYKAILTPIRKELEAISELRRQSDENEEILALQRTLNNEAVSAARKRTASLRIEEIRTGQRVRGLENERDAQTEVVNEQLAAAQKTQAELQKQLDLQKERFDAQQGFLNLVGDEASAFRQIAEEIKKLREKEKTDVEKQLEFAGLINDALDDTKKVAKAKFDLASGETTEFEKQQALLTLQTVEFERQQRAIKATELGFDPAILKQLEDVPVHLSDIGEKFDAASQFSTVNDLANNLGIQLPDFVTFAEDWNIELGKAHQWWLDIKDEINKTAEAINANLPKFLSIFPEQPGGEPPIVKNLRNMAFFIAAMTTLNILGRLGTLVGLLGTLGAFIGGGGAAAGGATAAGGGGAAAAGGGIGGALVSLGIGAVAVAIPIAIFVGGKTLIDSWAKELDDARAQLLIVQQKRQELLDDIAVTVGPQAAQELGTILGEGLGQFNSVLSTLGSFDAFTGQAVIGILKQQLQKGASKEDVTAALQEFFDLNFDAGTISESLRSQSEKLIQNVADSGVFKTFREQLAEAIRIGVSAPPDNAPDALSGDLLNETIVQSAAAADQEKLKTTVANAFGLPIISGLAQGLDPEVIKTTVLGQISTGTVAGLDANDPLVVNAVSSYIQALITQMATAAEIKSPSALSEREVGVPIGEGVLSGIASVADSIIESPILKKMMEAIAAPFKTAGTEAITALDTLKKDSDVSLRATTKNLTTIYDAFFLAIKTKFVTFRTDQNNAWIGIRSDATTQMAGMKDDILKLMEAMRLGISDLMGKIYDLIITNGFRKMRIDAETEITTLKTNVISALVTGEDSLINQLSKLIGGTEKETPAWNIGKNLITGIAQGITDNVSKLVEAMKAAIAKTFEETAKEYEISSPSQVAARMLGAPLGEGVGLGVMQKIPAIIAGVRQAMAAGLTSLVPSNSFAPTSSFTPQSVSNVSRSTTYQLNVNSAQASQGIISDFTILKVMGAGA